MSELEVILEKIDDLKRDPPKSHLSWLFPATVSALVALAISVVSQLLPDANSRLSHMKSISELQVKIVSDYNANEIQKGDMLLKYGLMPLYEFMTPYAFQDMFYQMSPFNMGKFNDFSKDIENLKTSKVEDGNANAKKFNGPDLSVNSQTYTAPSSAEIVEKFWGSGRLKYSDDIVGKFYNNSDVLAKALLESLLPDSDKKAYRVNLYIAFTLGRLPNGWSASADTTNAIERLEKNSENMSDKTFKQRVTEAIENRVSA